MEVCHDVLEDLQHFTGDAFHNLLINLLVNGILHNICMEIIFNMKYNAYILCIRIF